MNNRFTTDSLGTNINIGQIITIYKSYRFLFGITNAKTTPTSSNAGLFITAHVSGTYYIPAFYNKTTPMSVRLSMGSANGSLSIKFEDCSVSDAKIVSLYGCLV